MIDPGRSRISFAESFCGIESLYYFFDLLGFHSLIYSLIIYLRITKTDYNR